MDGGSPRRAPRVPVGLRAPRLRPAPPETIFFGDSRAQPGAAVGPTLPTGSCLQNRINHHCWLGRPPSRSKPFQIREGVTLNLLIRRKAGHDVELLIRRRKMRTRSLRERGFIVTVQMATCDSLAVLPRRRRPGPRRPLKPPWPPGTDSRQ